MAITTFDGYIAAQKVFADSALMLSVAPDSTPTGVPELRLQIASA